MLFSVLLLSRMLGSEVLGPGGRPVGRLADLSIRIDGEGTTQQVQRLVIGRRNAAVLLLPWAEVAAVRAGRVVLVVGDLSGFEIGSIAESLHPDEILLGRDVLDTQVIDVVGQRLARVADVLLTPAGAAGLEVFGVEVGFGGVLRRLGLRGVLRSDREDVVEWNDLHLTSERGHTVQLSASRSAVHRIDPRALAAVLSRMDTDSATEIITAKDPAVAAAALQSADPDIGERVLRAMSQPQAARIVAQMPPSHAGRWRQRLSRPRLEFGRHFLRSRVWSRRHLNWRGP